jgi:lysophospholipase L1-like esterase
MRLCFFGDSFVAGAGDDAALGWPGRLTAWARCAGVDVTAYNLGVRRDTSSDIAARWGAEAVARLPADFERRLAFSFGANDCVLDEHGASRVAHEQALANAESILSQARGVAPTIMIGPAPIADDPATGARIMRLSEDLEGVCAGLGVAYLPIFGHLMNCEIWMEEARRGDGAHPNSGGYAALAEFIGAWPAFRQWIRAA